MSTSRTSPWSSTLLLSFLIIFNVALTVLIRMSPFFKFDEVEIIQSANLHGEDYARLWPVNFGEPVKLFIEDTVHYQLEGTTDNDNEWEALTPGDGIVYLGDDHEPHSITMFHSLRCLNVLRQDLSSKPVPIASDLSRHCMNYLRQIITCNSDLHLAPLVGYRRNAHPDVYMCRDWSAVYQKYEENQKEHLRWLLENAPKLPRK
ncbi:hypothetical protein BT96DRAFT_998394 [Gymnopus androsaceus JB14]|uniref:Uncharacterized protein n=1 Tax=Gymnopus androsaceus JB14 TaxID=1447944 RepID=A0A6A4H8M2_9AGAR|nr:hypothetical protein BT96DRAFT_998394 [Gymnopus androsaceus JB14]